MKIYCTTFFLLLMLFSKQIYANQIDNLKTDKEVEDFLKLAHPQFAKNGSFSIYPTDSVAKALDCGGVFRQWKINNWQKVDITNDGLTDLLFIAHWYNYKSFVLIDDGANSFKLFWFSKNSFENCDFIKRIKINSKNYLKVYHKAVERDEQSKIPFSYKDLVIVDTLIFKFSDFIEFNPTPKNKSEIATIEIYTSTCFGTCPSFTLQLLESGLANFDGIDYTKFKGKSTKKLPTRFFEEIADLITYIDIKNLKDHYEVSWTDDQTATIKITFKDKSVKEISDYGKQGTFGLSAVYSKLIKIGTNWNSY